MKKILFLVVALLCIVGSQVVAQDTLAIKELWTKFASSTLLHLSNDMSKLYSFGYTGNMIRTLNPLTGELIDTLLFIPFSNLTPPEFMNDSLILIDNFRSSEETKDSLGGLMLYNVNAKKYKYLDSGYGSYDRYRYITYLPPNQKRVFIEKLNSQDQFTTHFLIFDFETWQIIKENTITRDPWSKESIRWINMITDSLALRYRTYQGSVFRTIELFNIYTWSTEKSRDYYQFDEGTYPTLSNSKNYVDLGYGNPKLIIRTDDLTVSNSIPDCWDCYSPFFVKSDRYLIFYKDNSNYVYDRESKQVIYKLDIPAAFDGFSENGELAWWNTIKMFKLNWDRILEVEESISNNRLYPNPVLPGTYLQIDSDEFINRAELFDLLGTSYRLELYNNEIKLPEHLSKGIYFLKYELGGNVMFGKVVVE